MQLQVIGINHKTANLNMREQLKFDNKTSRVYLRFLRLYNLCQEAVLLSTCNRTELYLVTYKEKNQYFPWQAILKYFQPEIYASKSFYRLQDEDCLRHLFNVASGLDSLIIGESQILGQIKDAYYLAKNAKSTGPILNIIFNKTLALGKSVRTKTNISQSSLSLASITTSLALKHSNATSPTIFIVGTGAISHLLIQYFFSKGIHSLYITSRNLEKAKAVAKKFNISAIQFEDQLAFAQNIPQVIITATSSPHFIYTPKNFSAHTNPLTLIDLSVPRNIDPKVKHLKNIVFYNLDNIEDIIQTHNKRRQKESLIVKTHIEKIVEETKIKLQYLNVRNTMLKLDSNAHILTNNLTKKLFLKLPHFTPKDRVVTEKIFLKFAHKLLRGPMIFVKESAGSNFEEEHCKEIEKIFALTHTRKDVTFNEK